MKKQSAQGKKIRVAKESVKKLSLQQLGNVAGGALSAAQVGC